jgi:hypothetical protein
MVMRATTLWLWMLWLGWATTLQAADASQPDQPQPDQLVAEDFLLHDVVGASSLAAALRKSDLDVSQEAAALGLVVKGPTKPEHAQQPVLAEIRSRIEGIDVTAGMQADRSMIREGPAQWIGGLGMAAENEAGRHALELRTSVGQNHQQGIIGLEVGPRFERRLPGGMLFILDGKAEARSLPTNQQFGGETLPGQANDGLSLIGLTGRTGLIR